MKGGWGRPARRGDHRIGGARFTGESMFESTCTHSG
jgi:hypothetical protein